MKDFYCPYCEHGMDKDEVNVHEDSVIGEWDDVECNACKKEFVLSAEPDILYSTTELEPAND